MCRSAYLDPSASAIAECALREEHDERYEQRAHTDTSGDGRDYQDYQDQLQESHGTSFALNGGCSSADPSSEEKERSFCQKRTFSLVLPSWGMLETHPQSADAGVSDRERILDASYELFSKRGIRAVGVNEVIERAGVATATLYRHFPSKDALVLAFLVLRE